MHRMGGGGGGVPRGALDVPALLPAQGKFGHEYLEFEFRPDGEVGAGRVLPWHAGVAAQHSVLPPQAPAFPTRTGDASAPACTPPPCS